FVFIGVCEYILFMCLFFFFFQAEDGIRDRNVTGVQTCALPILFTIIIICKKDNSFVIIVCFYFRCQTVKIFYICLKFFSLFKISKFIRDIVTVIIIVIII